MNVPALPAGAACNDAAAASAATPAPAASGALFGQSMSTVSKATASDSITTVLVIASSDE